MGLEVEFMLNSQLRRHILESIMKHRSQLVEAVSRKATMEEWRPMNLQTVNAIDKLKEEMAQAGLVNFTAYCKDPCFVRLSQTIVSYARTLVPHCNAGISLLYI